MKLPRRLGPIILSYFPLSFAVPQHATRVEIILDPETGVEMAAVSNATIRSKRPGSVSRLPSKMVTLWSCNRPPVSSQPKEKI